METTEAVIIDNQLSYIIAKHTQRDRKKTLKASELKFA